MIRSRSTGRSVAAGSQAPERRICVEVDGARSVSGILEAPRHASACYVVAHGAGAGMEHPFMAAVADGLFVRGIATLRYQFPYMEAGGKRPDRPPVAHAAVRAAVGKARDLLPALPLFAGGKSFGGRMASQAQAERPLPGVRGLAFLAFPLHPAKKPSTERADHLARVDVPMLFLQGTRDALAEMPLLAATVQRLGGRATLATLDGADHAFHVPAKSGRSDGQVLDEGLDAMVAWVDGVLRSMP
jgi:predicted alpha/beta-hydrolase family hydrolase